MAVYSRAAFYSKAPHPINHPNNRPVNRPANSLKNG